MVTCPRCQQPVDETVRSTCPLCFTPIPQAMQASPHGHPSGPLVAPGPEDSGPAFDLEVPSAGSPPVYGSPPVPPAAAPAAGPLPPAPHPMNPGARISLTGEVIDPGVPASPPAYVGGSGAAAPPRGAYPQHAAPGRAQSTARTVGAAAPEKRRSTPAVPIVVALVVLLGGGVGGWYWWMHRTNPKDQALAVYKAYLGQDYRTAYGLTEFSAADLQKYPNADAFASDADKMFNSIPQLKSAFMESAKAAASSATVGEPTIQGDKADVPTSSTATIFGRSIKMNGVAHMVNDNGIWKLDRSADTGSQGFGGLPAIIGKPDLQLGGAR